MEEGDCFLDIQPRSLAECAKIGFHLAKVREQLTRIASDALDLPPRERANRRDSSVHDIRLGSGYFQNTIFHTYKLPDSRVIQPPGVT
ncbi:hypothetical protein TWF696_008107 [Orbilia brochopaga]|uniref:Uncharacterized protein n=1 Tax=Orbilia brochopaga TaxID=3140254 RepID=A0AAV9UM25_9PEZI